ncbi:hypothetical protein PHSC3_000153 [Chlamydiales bacterium STE3]|nr:hypothetical protein PHSC3_000153 [Chlamydiales bacterium STE3]
MLKKEERIGFITSGSFSPMLNRSLALLISEQYLEYGEKVEVMIRDKSVLDEITKLPFLKKKLLK